MTLKSHVFYSNCLIRCVTFPFFSCLWNFLAISEWKVFLHHFLFSVLWCLVIQSICVRFEKCKIKINNIYILCLVFKIKPIKMVNLKVCILHSLVFLANIELFIASFTLHNDCVDSRLQPTKNKTWATKKLWRCISFLQNQSQNLNHLTRFLFFCLSCKHCLFSFRKCKSSLKIEFETEHMCKDKSFKC